MITATNKATGEVIELPSDTPEQIVAAWKIAQQYEKAAKSLKDQLKLLVPSIVHNGVSDEINGSIFRVSNVQRMTYDKTVMRRLLDPDLFDVLIKPDKTAVDKHLKEHLEEMADVSKELRDSMLPDGKGYEVIKLEKLG